MQHQIMRWTVRWNFASLVKNILDRHGTINQRNSQQQARRLLFISLLFVRLGDETKLSNNESEYPMSWTLPISWLDCMAAEQSSCVFLVYGSAGLFCVGAAWWFCFWLRCSFAQLQRLRLVLLIVSLLRGPTWWGCLPQTLIVVCCLLLVSCCCRLVLWCWLLYQIWCVSFSYWLQLAWYGCMW